MKNTYELIDSGDRRKLEQVGPYLLDRPAPHALWRRRADPSRWEQADARHVRNAEGDGTWQSHTPLPEGWEVDFCGQRFRIKPTPFGHLGLFPEQAENWRFLQEQVHQAKGPVEFLNLFAYTGGSTLAAARAGARMVHVDSARGVVAWARENADLSGLSGSPIRWIVEDTVRFVKREIRRKRRYDGILLDPPSFGRGRSGQVWKHENDLLPLLELLHQLFSDSPTCFLLSGHSPGFTPRVAEQMAHSIFGNLFTHFASGEMLIPQSAHPRPFPTGSWCRLWN